MENNLFLKSYKLSSLWIGVSFFLVAFGQPAWSTWFSLLTALGGYALFWKGALEITSLKPRFFVAWIWYACVQAVQLSWMTSLQYQGPYLLLIYGLLLILLGLQFAGLTHFFLKRGGQKVSFCFRDILFAASFWTWMEWIRLFWVSGFTWNPAGLALTFHPIPMQMASLVGVYGLSFWVMLTNATAFFALQQRSKNKGIAWALLAVFPFCFGAFHIKGWKTVLGTPSSLSALLVQTSLRPEQKLLGYPGYSAEHFISPAEQWRAIFQEVKACERPLDLMVLPEVALPFEALRCIYPLKGVSLLWNRVFSESLEAVQPELKAPYALFQEGEWFVCNAFIVQSLANLKQCEVIAGLDATDWDDLSQSQKNFNAAFHFSPGSEIYSRYEKRILVPLGEYIPYAWCASLAARFGIFSSFSCGEKAKVFSQKYPLSISICYEETYGHLVREGRKLGAHLLVNLSNDAWFPESKLAKQHYLHGKLRAVENGAALLRSTNAGITVAVDAFGAEIQSLDSLEKSPKTSASLWVKLPYFHYPTLYTWAGDLPLLILSLICLGFCRKREKKLRN